MKLISLTQGQFSKVDDDMYPFLIHWKWCAHWHKEHNTFYAVRNQVIDRKNYLIRMHRFILGITDSNIEIDHINHDGLYNLITNIRIATPSQNSCNTRPRINCSSIYKGVWWNQEKQLWSSQITLNKKRIHVGHFNSEIQAAKERDKKAIELHGEFAFLNFPAL